jgi:hypothetical protein
MQLSGCAPTPGLQSVMGAPVISVWLKITYTLFVCVLIPVYWVAYGPINFLWGSDIALLLTVLALWTENRSLASMMSLGVLVPELAWNIDFALRLIFGPEAIPLAGTRYMFSADIPLIVRAFSLFHIFLPVVLLWLMYRLGYQRKALLYQTLLAWLILPISYALSDPSANINWVHGFGDEPQTWMPGPLYVALLMVLFPLGLYVPTHLLLGKLFPGPRYSPP